MFRFALLLLVLTIPTVCFWLDRKRLLRGHALLVTAALLLSLVLVPLLLFLAFSVVAYSFRGEAFENTMAALIASVGVACVVWGALTRTRAAIALLSAGVVELAALLLAWLGPLQERKLPEPVGLGSSIRCA